MTLGVILLIIVAAVTILSRVVRVRVNVAGGMSFRDLREFSNEFHQRLSQYMQNNYSGDPAGLESALRGFMPIAREMVARRSQPIDDQILRTLIVSSIAARRTARRDEIESALDNVLQPERKAA
jgi:hypothetical protein